MPTRSHALTPEALAMIDTIARRGSFAAAARELGKVPSALTYSVRQLEEALDVLLFDRRSGQARLTAAGDELLHEGRRLLADVEAVANRVQRIATGWESTLTLAVDVVISTRTVFELCEAFYALRPDRADGRSGPVTRLRVRSEVLSGTVEALTSGHADLAIGVATAGAPRAGIEMRPLGELEFVFAVAPSHPLAAHAGTISAAQLLQHRAVAVADTARVGSAVTVNLLPGQDVLTVPTTRDKIDAQLRGLGCGFVPEPMARAHIAAGRLVVKAVQARAPRARMGYAWRGSARTGRAKSMPDGQALQWWLGQLESPATRLALLERHDELPPI